MLFISSVFIYLLAFVVRRNVFVRMLQSVRNKVVKIATNHFQSELLCILLKLIKVEFEIFITLTSIQSNYFVQI